ncbi:hypothetical protein [Oceanicoccus sagamiensis]|uniref:hypothetical protein n=1 Tax=Oceanicoccus sagamiensis TaxID=716816 RepID=UPI00198142D4|nr:hypothetical protein [Oceanicoccus sagamiensis]
MGFKERKKQVLHCLQHGYVLHQQRSHIDIKNLLAVGDVSLAEVAAIIGRAGVKPTVPALTIWISVLMFIFWQQGIRAKTGISNGIFWNLIAFLSVFIIRD